MDWTVPAYMAAIDGAQKLPYDRHRQAAWDADNMVTESTRMTTAEDARLRRCCHEARVTRYTLINYMLRLFMASWDATSRKKG